MSLNIENSQKKKLIQTCQKIWKKRISQYIWVDQEDEKQDPHHLAYKRLDCLRAFLLPIAKDLLHLNDLSFLGDAKAELQEEILGLASFLSDDNTHFYSAPHVMSMMPQPDDYTDMASHSILFALYALKLDWKKKDLVCFHKLISKALGLLCDKSHYYSDKELISWGGTISKPQQDNPGIDVRSVYFTSQVLTALHEVLSFEQDSGINIISDDIETDSIEQIINSGCRWLMRQTHHPQFGILTQNEEKGDSGIDEIIMANVEGLKICCSCFEMLDSENQTKTNQIAQKFVEFLASNEPQYKAWHHNTYTTHLNYQFYQDRQDSFGIVTLLSKLKGPVYKDYPAAIEILAEKYISNDLQVDVDNLLIGCLPWFVEDTIASAIFFQELQKSNPVTKNILRKAISGAFQDQSVIDYLSKVIISKIKDIANIDEIKGATRLQAGENRTKKSGKKKARKIGK